MTEEKSFGNVVDDKIVELENKYDEWANEKADLYARRFVNLTSETEIAEMLCHIFTSMENTIIRHSKSIRALQESRNIC